MVEDSEQAAIIEGARVPGVTCERHVDLGAVVVPGAELEPAGQHFILIGCLAADCGRKWWKGVGVNPNWAIPARHS